MNKEEILEEEYESPYCDVCGHCGDIGCCGIRNFITEHIEGKTNCKNESWVISDLISLCDYKDDIFEQNKKLKKRIDKAIECINYYAVENEDYSKIYSIEEQDLLKILKGDSNE